MPPAEFRDGTEVRRIEPTQCHEIDALAARLGNTARGINATAIGIEQQRRHHDWIERRLAAIAFIATADLGNWDYA
jgi:hypothetical protein